VFTADAGKNRRNRCKNGMCSVQQPAPRVTAPTVAATTSWIASQINQGTQNSQTISFDIQRLVMELEAKLKQLNGQLAQLEAKNATEKAMMPVRNKIKAMEEELNKLKKLQNCATR
jgi:cell shape-determining protein MreC